MQHDLPFLGLDHTFFPARGGCRMRLYKDAHVDHVPEIPLAGNRLYQPPCYWIDLYNAICAARHFIYVTGASIQTAAVVALTGPMSAGLAVLCNQSLAPRGMSIISTATAEIHASSHRWFRARMLTAQRRCQCRGSQGSGCAARHQLHSVLRLRMDHLTGSPVARLRARSLC